MAELPTLAGHELKHILEAALLAADEPLSQAQLAGIFTDEERPSNTQIGQALEALAEDCADRGVELKEVASGFRLQVKLGLNDWVSRLWTEKPQKYSRAMLETLSLIAYRQPITRGEIESVRGVSLSSNIIRSLQEREWIRIVGHRDVPGKPALFGTTKAFLDYFNLKSLDELPTLSEIKDMESLEPELEFEGEAGGEENTPEAADTAQAAANDAESGDAPEAGMDGEGALAEEDGEFVEEPQFDDDAEDDDLDQAFAQLDKAFVNAEDIDLGEDPPAADAGVDPDSPQADMVAEAADERSETAVDGADHAEAETDDDEPPRQKPS